MEVLPLLPLLIAGLLVGFSLTSIPAASHLVLPIMVSFFNNPLLASGTLLPILIIGDIITISIYRKHFNKRFFLSFIPYVIVGVALGGFGLSFIQNPIYFRRVIAALLLIPLLSLLIGSKLSKAKWQQKKGMHGLFIFLSAFFACLGHMGGPIASTYLLGKQGEKEKFIVSYSSLFILINCLKIPIYWHYEMITLETGVWSAYTTIFVIIGCILGYKFIRSIPQRYFERAIIGFILVSCVLIFLRS